jgi:hypothetical protein
MEALTAVQVGLLTVYDMVKAVAFGSPGTDMGGAWTLLALESRSRSGALRWSAALDRSKIGASCAGQSRDSLTRLDRVQRLRHRR